MRGLRRLITLIAACVLATPVVAYGQSLTILWDANPAGDQVTSYDVCISTTTPLSCNFRLASVPATQTAYAFTPVAGVLYRAAVRAVNANGAGQYSTEVLVSIPSLAQPADQTSTVNTPISNLTLSASDPDGGTLQFSHTGGLPFGLTLNTTTGVISGTPTSANTYSVTVTVTDGMATTSRTFNWVVQPPAAPDTTAPSLSITSHTPNQSVTTASITLAGTATDNGAGGNGVTVTVNGGTAGSATGNNVAQWSRSVSLSIGANNILVDARDNAGNVRSSQITINRAIAPVTGVTLSGSLASPRETGTAITFTAAGTGGVTPRQYKFFVQQGSAAAQVVQNWSTTATYTWTPTTAGNYTVSVWARSAGATADVAEASAQMPFVITAPLSITSLTSNVASPQTQGASITFNATAAGGTAPYQYKWWVQSSGTTTWTMLRDWSTSASVTWQPTAAGTYTIAVWGRNAGVTADASQALSQVNYTINAAIPSISSLTSNLASPQLANTTITFTAAAAGGIAPYQYKWWVQSGGSTTWTMLRDWGTSASVTWQPTAAGTYTVAVWVRNAGVTADASQGLAQMNYTITAPATPLSISSLTSNIGSPQVTNTTINFTAVAAGGTSPYQFKWWVQSGSSSTIAQNWSSNATLAWSPTTAGTYTVTVWARNAGVTADAAQASAQVNYTITAPIPPLSISSLTSNVASPQVANTTINFTAVAAGGTSPYQFKWWVQSGSSSTIAQDWSSNATLAWSPTTAGTYTVTVWARNAGVTADAAQASAQVNYTITAPIPPLSISSLTSNVASPQVANTTINFTAVAAGGTSPYQFKWWVQTGSTWAIAQNWSTSATLAWTPSTSGTYVVAVWARNAGVTADASQALSQVNYTITAPIPPLSISSLTSNLASPQVTGTTINFTAAAAGGTAPYQFKFWVQSGSTSTIAQDWSSNATLAWSPSTAGSYTVTVWARNAGVTADAAQASAQANYTINAPASPLSISSLTSTVATPQSVGTAITFNATATGGTAPYQFKWWVQSGGSWTMAQNWSASPTFTWTPTSVGTYAVAVWARNAGVTADASQALSQVNYTITSGLPTVSSLTSNVASPTAVGTAITFNATAGGGTAPYQYKWWVQSGGSWTMAQNWSATPTFTWTPTLAGTYAVAVWVRNAGVTADASQALSQVNYTITSGLPTVSSLTSNVASPQAVGSAITFNATAGGGTAPYQYKWWVQSGGSWTMAQNWSASATFTWTPTLAGTYAVAVWVRNAGVTADASQALSQVNYTITTGLPTLTSLTSNVASPQTAGTAITFNATAGGGNAPYQFKWWLQSGGSWTIARDWSTNSAFTWTPTASGSYTVAVWVRNAGVTADASQAMGQVSFLITAGASTTPLSVTSLTSNVASPQAPGAAITFTAAAAGGTAPYQYKWWVQSGGTWAIAQDWSTSPSMTWQPSSPGSYMVAVWARNAGVTADASQGLAQVPYVINGSAAPLSVTSLTSNLSSPQGSGTTITFTAAATGGTAPYQFKWWVQSGNTWTIAQDWSSSATLTWRPLVSGAYSVAVWARNAGVTSDASQAMSQVSYAITPGAPTNPLVLGLTSNVASPQILGASITFTASATGGTSPYQFKWWVYDGGQWTIARDWGASATFTWQPTRPGTYLVAAWVRNAGVTTDASQAMAQTSYVITTASGIPPAITSFTSSVASPTTTGTTVTFSTTVAGGLGPHQFKWWVFSQGDWSIAQEWSNSSTLAWRPTRPGSYIVAVWVRNAGVSEDASQAMTQVQYIVTP